MAAIVRNRLVKLIVLISGHCSGGGHACDYKQLSLSRTVNMKFGCFFWGGVLEYVAEEDRFLGKRFVNGGSYQRVYYGAATADFWKMSRRTFYFVN